MAIEASRLMCHPFGDPSERIIGVVGDKSYANSFPVVI